MTKTNRPDRLLNWLLWGIILLLIVPLYLRIAWVDPVDFQNGGLGAADFKAYYIASRLLTRDELIYDPAAHDAEMVRLGYEPDATYYFYPSVLAHALTPISGLPIETAARIWNTVNLVLCVAVLWMLTQAFDLRTKLGRHFPWLIILIALAAPVFTALRIGQANVLLLFFLTVAWYFYRQGRETAVGVALALASLIKIFPIAFLLWFLWKRQMRVLAAFGLTFVSVLGVNALLLAWRGHNWLLDVYYFTQASTFIQLPSHKNNHALVGFLSRFSISPPVSGGLLVGLSLVILGITAVSVWRVGKEDKYGLGLALLLMAILLVGGVTWTTTLILLMIPFVILIALWHDNGRPLWMLLLLFTSYLLINGTRILFATGINIQTSPWLMGIPTGGLLLLWAMAVVVGLRYSFQGNGRLTFH